MIPNEQIVQVPMIVDILPNDIEQEINRAKIGRQALDRLFKELLVQGVDFDRVPGTDKPTLLKPGGELLCQIFHLAPGKADMISKDEDWQNSVFSYIVGVPIYHRDTGVLVAYGIGAANSKEPKYRYRKEDVDGESIRIENPDPAGQQNTLVKMASKRAFIDGVLKATGASRMFTQDVEDLLLPEKASKKQINYLKSLFRGKNETEIIAEVIAIIGRSIESLDELTREEASKAIETKKGNEAHQEATPKNGNSDKATDAQIKALFAIAKRIHKGQPDEEINEWLHIKAKEKFDVDSLKDLTKGQASTFIEELQATGA